MELKENSQKKVLLSVLGVAILIVAVVGISFAAFNISHTSANTNTISSGTLMVSYSEDSQAINITNAMPMTDDVALSEENLKATNESFTFTVVTNASNAVTVPYTVSLTPVTTSTLTNEQVKVYLTKRGSAVSETSTPKLVSSLATYNGHERTGSFILHEESDVYGATGGTTTSEYNLKMWVDSSVNADQGKTYQAKVNVDADVTALGSN